MIGRTYDNVSIPPTVHVWRYFVQSTDYEVPLRTLPLPENAPSLPNISALCIDRHLGDYADRTAMAWQKSDTLPDGLVSYRALHEQVCRLANALTDQGVERGDRVAIHLPLMVESVVAVLACIRIGAVHVVLAAGLDVPALAERLADSRAVAVLTCHETDDDTGRKAILDRALDTAGSRCRVRLVLVIAPDAVDVPMKPGRDHRYDAVVDWYEPDFPPALMSPDDPLFLLYPSGRLGKGHGMTYTAGKYTRLITYAMETLAPSSHGEIPYSLLDMAWNAGQTSLLVSVLAKGGTIANPRNPARTGDA